MDWELQKLIDKFNNLLACRNGMLAAGADTGPDSRIAQIDKELHELEELIAVLRSQE